MDMVEQVGFYMMAHRFDEASPKQVQALSVRRRDRVIRNAYPLIQRLRDVELLTWQQIAAQLNARMMEKPDLMPLMGVQWNALMVRTVVQRIEEGEWKLSTDSR